MSIIGAASEGTLLDARHPNAGRAVDVARTFWIAGALAPAAAGLARHDLSDGQLADGRVPLPGMLAGGARPCMAFLGDPAADLAQPDALAPDAALPASVLAVARSGAMAGLPAAAMPVPVMPVPPAVAEQIILLFTILGWRLAPAGPARLALFLDGNCIRVVPDDPALLAPLAAAGLDRLVLPLSLAALEDLAALAG